MVKTEMTLAIEKAVRYYHPSEVCGIRVNKFRSTHTAFEVPAVCGTTKGGLVDCIRVQEYFGGIHRTGICHWGTTRNRGPGSPEERANCKLGYGIGEKPELCDESGCPFRFVREQGTADILITCFEIKVTKSDFKSKNGHNFVGNCNYYIIPKELYGSVADMVPEDIGIILYLHAGSYIGLRRKKECAFRQLTDEAQKWLVLSVMKRLEDTTWKERTQGKNLALW